MVRLRWGPALLVLATKLMLSSALQTSLDHISSKSRALESVLLDIHVDDYRKFDLMDKDFNEYLPHASEMATHPNLPEADEFKRHLGYLLSSRCSQPQRLTSTLNFGGFGSMLHSSIKPIMWGMKYGYCMNLNFDNFVYGKSKDYFQQNFPNDTNAFSPPADSFDRIPDCRTDLEAQNVRADRFDVPLDAQESYVASDGEEEHPCLRELPMLEQKSEEFMPKLFRGQPAFFAVSNIFHALFSPSSLMERKLTEMKKRINWPSDRKVLGLHVRLGDACSDETQTWRGITCYPLSRFMGKVKEVTKLYGIKDIFLVSESNSTFQEAQNYPEFNWITNGAPPPIPANVGIEQALLGKKSTGKEVGERWYLEMMLMAESHAMIGKFSSNFFRAALEFNFGSTHSLKPYVSMDSSWCFGFGELHPLIKPVSDEIEEAFQPEGQRVYSDRHKFIC
mmetsp:Transcript_22947/g.36862  ORF Transcript_22947/g.36862 Transcript_22947/m.36862 type:complete len:449 (-) Transcript_22947:229-1575(-)